MANINPNANLGPPPPAPIVIPSANTTPLVVSNPIPAGWIVGFIVLIVGDVFLWRYKKSYGQIGLILIVLLGLYVYADLNWSVS